MGGYGTFELSLARNSDKLLVKLDGPEPPKPADGRSTEQRGRAERMASRTRDLVGTVGGRWKDESLENGEAIVEASG